MWEVKYYLACLDSIKKIYGYTKGVGFPLNKKAKGICLSELVAYTKKGEIKQWTK